VHLVISILSLFLFLVVNCSAHTNICQCENIQEEISRLIPNAIDRIENDRIYFKAEKITQFEGNFYIEGVCLPTAHSDQSGVYLQKGARPPRPIEERAIYICTKCSWVHNYEPTICERSGCLGRDFIVRYR
jgi:hypothetical protein